MPRWAGIEDDIVASMVLLCFFPPYSCLLMATYVVFSTQLYHALLPIRWDTAPPH